MSALPIGNGLSANPASTDVDAVFPWIDTNQRGTREAARRFAVPVQRLRDNGELRFALRSLEQYAPWVRHVHLLTPDRPPAWLAVDHPRLRIVRHEVLFPDPSVLPSFNSNAIETNLHRVPGLSRHFLYFNDDVFLGAARPQDAYRLPQGGQVYFLDDPILPRDPAHGALHDRAYAHTAAVMEEAGAPRVVRRLPGHCAQLYDVRRLASLERRFTEHYERTRRNRVRSVDDWVFRIAYMIDLLEGPDRASHRAEALRWEAGGYRLVRLGANPVAALRALRNLERLRPAEFCINDEMGPVGGGLASWLVRRFLRRRFAVPSSFERSA